MFDLVLNIYVSETYENQTLLRMHSLGLHWRIQNPVKQPLTIFTKSFILDLWLGSEYVSWFSISFRIVVFRARKKNNFFVYIDLLRTKLDIRCNNFIISALVFCYHLNS